MWTLQQHTTTCIWSLPDVELICRLVFKQRPVTAEFSGLSRAKHFASLHLFALLTRQRHMHLGVVGHLLWTDTALTNNKDRQMNKSRLIMTHLIAWIVLSLIFFFSSESLTKLVAPDFHDVTIWLTIMLTGLVLIFFGVTASLTIKLIKRSRK